MKFLIGFGAFFGTFLVYHLIGCQIFPVDENNVLQAPDIYLVVGMAISAFVTYRALKSWKSRNPKKIVEKRMAEELNRKPYKEYNAKNTLLQVDAMDGHSFEHWCAEILSKNGFSNVSVTPGSGDHGVDVLAEKDGIRYAVQCKCYSHDLGNTPVQEVYAGKEMYRCQVGVVMTNRYFTAGAKALAEQTRVLLWDRDKLQSLIASAE